MQPNSVERQRLYWVWADMRQRCSNPNHKAFANYGGRGIKVTERWQAFENFLSDMWPRPDGGLLERVNNDGDYGNDNCKWATRKEQNSNRRNCIHVDDGGETVTLKEKCRRLGLPYRPIIKRIKERNWPIEKALSLPLGTRLEKA